MTTAPVMTVTDELLAELEELAFECNQHGGNWYEPRHMAAFPEYSCDQDFVVSASPATITALTAELRRLRAENAELGSLLREAGKTIHKLQAEQPTPLRIARYLDAMRAKIDTAMAAQ